jgi:hypothetical protein
MTNVEGMDQSAHVRREARRTIRHGFIPSSFVICHFISAHAERKTGAIFNDGFSD